MILLDVDQKKGHFKPLPADAIPETVEAEPKVPCDDEEVLGVLADLKVAVEKEIYIPATSTKDTPALSDMYLFDEEDEKLILKNLELSNFVDKIVDVGKGAKKRMKNGFPQDYLYVFKYACVLSRRDVEIDGVAQENVLIYIKINDRKVPDHVVYIVSFHKNKPKS